MTALQLPDIAPSGHIVVGVDTHKHIHVAAVVDTTAGLRSTLSVTADRDGFEKLLAWHALLVESWPLVWKAPVPTAPL